MGPRYSRRCAWTQIGTVDAPARCTRGYVGGGLIVDTQDRQDRGLQVVLGDNLMAGTLRLFLAMGVLSAIGGVVFWCLAHR